MTALSQSVTEMFDLFSALGVIAATVGPILTALVLLSYESWKRNVV